MVEPRVDNIEEDDDLMDPNNYQARVEVKLDKTIDSVFKERWDGTGNTPFWPGFKQKTLRELNTAKKEGGPAIRDFIEDSKTDAKTYFQMVCYPKNDKEKYRETDNKVLTWQIKDFRFRSVALAKIWEWIEDRDLCGGIIEMKQKLSPLAGEKCIYIVEVRIKGKRVRNVGSELMIILSSILEDHAKAVYSYNTGFLHKFKEFVTFKLPNKINSIPQSLNSIGGTIKLLLSVQQSLLAKSKNSKIYQERYEHVQSLNDFQDPRFLVKAGSIGHNFDAHAIQEIVRQLAYFVSFQTKLIRRSGEEQDQYMAMVPQQKKYDFIRNFVTQNIKNDELFVNELFNGTNPVTIRVVDPANPTYNKAFNGIQDLQGKPIDLGSYQKGDLFVSSYRAMRKYVHPNLKDDTREILCMEPEILTSITKEGDSIKVRIVGIGFYFEEDGKGFEVFTPPGFQWNGIKTPKRLWALAKMHALCADASYHEAVTHLGRAHLFGETFAIAHHNTYIYQRKGGFFHDKELTGQQQFGEFLEPHFTHLIAVNNLARQTLIAEVNNTLNPFMGCRGTDFLNMIGAWYNQKILDDGDIGIWNSVGFEEELASRGFNQDFKYKDYYRYMKDGQKINNAIQKYVRNEIVTFFKSDEDVQKDGYLKNFFEEVSHQDKGDFPGFPKNPTSINQLVDALTRIIWEQSGYHSAVNFSQASSYGYVVFRPSCMRRPMPRYSSLKDLKEEKKRYVSEDQDITLRFIQESLPPNGIHISALTLYDILTSRTIPTLDTLRNPYIHTVKDDKIFKAQGHVDEFKKDLELIEDQILEENARVKDLRPYFPYEHLLPSQIDISIGI